MKNYLKTRILLIGISLLLWNCQKETELTDENQVNSVKIVISL